MQISSISWYPHVDEKPVDSKSRTTWEPKCQELNSAIIHNTVFFSHFQLLLFSHAFSLANRKERDVVSFDISKVFQSDKLQKLFIKESNKKKKNLIQVITKVREWIRKI